MHDDVCYLGMYERDSPEGHAARRMRAAGEAVVSVESGWLAQAAMFAFAFVLCHSLLFRFVRLSDTLMP